MPTKPAKKPKTSTPRQGEYLGRLEAGKGRRLVVDLDGAHDAALTRLMKADNLNQSDAIRKAIREADVRRVSSKTT